MPFSCNLKENEILVVLFLNPLSSELKRTYQIQFRNYRVSIVVVIEPDGQVIFSIVVLISCYQTNSSLKLFMFQIHC